MLGLLFLPAFLATVATAAPAPRYSCGGETVNVTSTWSLPLSWLADNQRCTLGFTVPNGYFPALNVTVTGVASGWKASEQFSINDDFNDSVFIDGGSFSANMAYPGKFRIFIQTLADTQMMLSITVTAYKATPNNVVANHVVGKNLPSTVLDLSQMTEGTSVLIKPQENYWQQKTDLYNAVGDGDSNECNNIFVYSNGTLIGTMRHALREKLSVSGDVLLYFAKKTSLTGAILAIDNINIQSLGSYYVFYSPISQPQQTVILNFNGGKSTTLYEAFTIISDANSAFDVRNIYGDGQVSYIGSGPMQNFNATSVNPNQLPMHFGGNINTFYNINGQTSVKFTVSP